MGMREQKKEQTRRRISDVATRLFLERGYDAVTTAEVAEAAEVSPATLFNYFPAKEALVFDEDGALGDALVSAITARPAGTGVLDALRQAILDGPYLRFAHDSAYRPFFDLIHSTPALSSYARAMATRYERAIADAMGDMASEAEAQAAAHYVVEALFAAQRSAQPIETFNTLIDLFKTGFAR
jgi:AcrR family transcriptional regulator